jgi:hypothetical protein
MLNALSGYTYNLRVTDVSHAAFHGTGARSGTGGRLWSWRRFPYVIGLPFPLATALSRRHMGKGQYIVVY